MRYSTKLKEKEVKMSIQYKTAEIIKRAKEIGVVIPAFNIPYFPMMEPVIEAVKDQDSFALIETAMIEWKKFDPDGPEDIYEEYVKYEDPDHVRLHLDHVPVIDEEYKRVDFIPVIQEAIALGYQSVMIDGSRLDLEENIKATRQVAELAHQAGIVCEAELGAVMGHESGPMPSYEEIFRTGRGFTRIDEAERFVKESECDWLSVAVGSIHGAVSDALRNQKKPAAKIDIEHLRKLKEVTGIPLVLHGGSGVQREYVLEAIKNGIAKINVGTEIRQAYEMTLKESGQVSAAQKATYDSVVSLIKDYYNIAGIRSKLN
jgi:ketose-bisphosphate aldolase